MKPILYDGTETTFTSNGLGRIDAISCTVTEERNGQYELEMVMSIDDLHYSDVQEGRLLYVRHDDTTDKQPFEIYQITRPINGQVTVYAHHISYRTSKITVMPFTASGIALAGYNLMQYAVGDNPFTFYTDKATSGTYTVDKPEIMRSLLGGSSGSLLDVFGTGEYKWDKFRVCLYASRGSSTDVVLRYGKDITDLKKTTDMDEVWTGVVPYWTGDDGDGNEVTVTLTENVLYSSYADDYDYKMVIPLDLSSEFDSQPTEAQLRAKAQTYITNNAKSAIPETIDISFAALWQTDEYKNVATLQRLSLCDTLQVVYTKLGVNSTAKIIKTVYNVLLERYDSMTIGEARTTLANTITGDLQAAVDSLQASAVTTSQATSMMQDAIDNATNLITGGSGGHIVIGTDANGQPNEIYAMDTASTATATNVLRINVNGIGFSSTGINGTYTSAWTLDGAFVANFITAGQLNAGIITTGAITGTHGTDSLTIDLDNATMTCTSFTLNASNISISETNGFWVTYTPTIEDNGGVSPSDPDNLLTATYKLALNNNGVEFSVGSASSLTISEYIYDTVDSDDNNYYVDGGVMIYEKRSKGMKLKTGGALTIASTYAPSSSATAMVLSVGNSSSITGYANMTLKNYSYGNINIGADGGTVNIRGGNKVGSTYGVRIRAYDSDSQVYSKVAIEGTDIRLVCQDSSSKVIIDGNLYLDSSDTIYIYYNNWNYQAVTWSGGGTSFAALNNIEFVNGILVTAS